MAYRFTLRLADGEDAGEATYGLNPSPGDVIYVDGAKRMRVTAVIPVEVAGEFVDGATVAVLEVQPV